MEDDRMPLFLINGFLEAGKLLLSNSRFSRITFSRKERLY